MAHAPVNQAPCVYAKESHRATAACALAASSFLPEASLNQETPDTADITDAPPPDISAAYGEGEWGDSGTPPPLYPPE